MELEKLPILKSYFSTCNLSQVYFDPVGEKLISRTTNSRKKREEPFFAVLENGRFPGMVGAEACSPHAIHLHSS